VPRYNRLHAASRVFGIATLQEPLT
jgi:hypothetical protein